MAQLDHQFGIADESTYGTSVTPARFFEYNSESVKEEEGRTEGDPMRTALVQRSDRFTPYFKGASGPIQLDVLTKGFGILLKHIFGQVVTSGPTETVVFTHTATMADLFGKSFTGQFNRPFHPTGTNQPFLFKGCKVTSATFSCDLEKNLVLDLEIDGQQVDTATALATASYPTLMDNLSWAGGVVTVGGSAFDVTAFSLKISNELDVDRRFIRGNTDKKEPTGGRRKVEFSLEADFDTLTQRNRAHATTKAAALAQIVATFNGPSIIPGATTLTPQLAFTMPACRFDAWEGFTTDDKGVKQKLSGEVRFDGTSSPVTAAYRSADTVA